MIVCTLHWYFRQIHLESVADRMRVLGPPVLRGFHDEAFGAVMLFEGTHRILAAHQGGDAASADRIDRYEDNDDERSKPATRRKRRRLG